MNEIAIFYITHENANKAKTLVKQCLKKNLIACANISTIDSCYFWKDSFTEDEEYVSILKTSISKIEELQAFINEIHPYETPCILHWVVKANQRFCNWVESQVD